MGNNPSAYSDCGENCPVERVSWWDAVAYVNALSAREGLEQCYDLRGCSGVPGDGEYECSSVSFAGLSCEGYRLPTEAEWEYAVRAGTRGARYASLDDIAWYNDNRPGSGTQPVRGRRANGWGLYDMVGNVREWCHDWRGPYEGGIQVDPVGPEAGSNRVVRGCSWSFSARGCRAANRSNGAPSERSGDVGLRPARSLSP